MYCTVLLLGAVLSLDSDANGLQGQRETGIGGGRRNALIHFSCFDSARFLVFSETITTPFQKSVRLLGFHS